MSQNDTSTQTQTGAGKQVSVAVEQGFKAEVTSVRKLLQQKLEIPDYQRPYTWQAQHMGQLVDDVILHQQREGRYRIGTVVLHEDMQSKLNVVDGQQRLFSLSMLVGLLSRKLDNNKTLCSPTLLKQPVKSRISLQNLQRNAAVARARMPADKTQCHALLNFLLNRCELVQVELRDISEAFQFFDSQNARGKSLDPHDLLKAFHLREMTDLPDKEKFNYVQQWEQSIKPANDSLALHSLMNDYLYRARRWSIGGDGRRFGSADISVFKGISPATDRYPHTDQLRYADHTASQFKALEHACVGDRKNIRGYPFQMTQTLLNGERFFEYVAAYRALYSRLFVGTEARLIQWVQLVESYPKAYRAGDSYTRNLFYCALMMYYDRFGEQQLDQAAVLCFQWSYRIRLNQSSVFLATVDKEARKPDGLLRLIARAIHPQEVLNFVIDPLDPSKEPDNSLESIRKTFDTGVLQ